MKSAYLFGLVWLLITQTAPAIDLGHGLSLKGFGTLGMVSSTNSQADYVSGFYSQAQGVGYTDSTSLLVDSKLGLQLDYAFLIVGSLPFNR